MAWGNSYDAKTSRTRQKTFERKTLDQVAAFTSRCALAPPGWQCTRTAGHEGPCAAIDLHAGDETPNRA